MSTIEEIKNVKNVTRKIIIPSIGVNENVMNIERVIIDQLPINY